MTETLRSKAWLLLGGADSLGGVLQLVDGRLSFTAKPSGAAGLVGLTLGRNLRALEKKVHHPGLAKKLGWKAVLNDEPVKVFDVPFDQVEKAVFPWYYFGRGAHLVIRGERLPFSFVRPQNARLPTDSQRIAGGIEFFKKGDTGKAWKAALSTKI